MKTNEEITAVVQRLISRVKELPDGECTTTGRLLHDIGVEYIEWSDDLMEIHFGFLRAAEEEDIFLDFSSHNNKIEGLPYNFHFIVYHKAKTHWYCAVKVKGVSRAYSYISDTGYIDEGSYVEVPFGSSNAMRIGIVDECGAYREENAPYPVRNTKHITRIATKEEYDAQGDLDP